MLPEIAIALSLIINQDVKEVKPKVPDIEVPVIVTPYTINSSSCPNGNCNTPSSSGSSRWYLGKNLGW